MINRLNYLVTNTDLDFNLPPNNHHKEIFEEDHLPDPSLLESFDTDQHEDIRTEIQQMIHTSRENGLPKGSVSMFEQLLESNINIFRTTFSSGKPVEVEPLKIELKSDVR